MTGKFDRNIELTHRFLSGESAKDLAAEYGVGATRVRDIANEHKPLIAYQDGRTVPSGLSLRAAVAIERSTGIWPSIADAEEIAGRTLDVLRKPGVRRQVYLELKSWLASLGLTDENEGI